MIIKNFPRNFSTSKSVLAKQSIKNGGSFIKQLSIGFALMLLASLITKQSFAQTIGITAQGTTAYPQTMYGHTATASTGDNAGKFLIFDSVQITTPTTAIAIGSWGSVSGTTTVSLYADASGVPGSELTTPVTATTVAGGITTYTLTTPIYLAPGTYWIAYGMNSTTSSADFVGKNAGSAGVFYRRSLSLNYTTSFPNPAGTTTNLGVTTLDDIFIVGVPIQGYAVATKAVLGGTASEDITSMSFYASALGTLRLAVYSDASGAPGTKLWDNNASTTITAIGVTTLNISTGSPSLLVLNPGTYWLAWQWAPTTSPTFGPSYTAGTAGQGNYIVQTYGTFPTTWGTGTSTSNTWTVSAAYTPALPAGTISGSPFCASSAVAVSVPYSSASGIAYTGGVGGNTFTVQLSNSTGSFTSPTSIGTTAVSTATSSTITTASIPSGTAAGTGYRIRVVSSNPAYIGIDNGVDLTINPAASAVTNTTLTASGTYGTPITNYTITATNNPTSFAATGLPPGLSINTSTGIISGTPTSPGSYTTTISATNSCGTGTTKNVAFTIAKATLTISAPIVTKVYDATMAGGTVTIGTLSGLVGSETLVVTAVAGAYTSANVGAAYTVTITYTLADGTNGGLAANYTLANGSITNAAITPKALTVTGLSVTSRAYNGSTTATITGTAALLAVEAAGAGSTSDGKPYTSSPAAIGITTSAFTAAFNTKDVLTANLVTISAGLTLTGSLKANYTIQNTITATITPKALTVGTPSIASKTYDGTPTAGAVTVGTLSGFVGTETVTATATAANYTGSNANTYTGDVITYTLASGTNGGVASNYSLANGSATGIITAKALTITASTVSKVYDATNNPGNVTEGTLSGFVGTETVIATGTAGNYTGTTVGTTYTVTISYALSNGTNGGLAANYTLANGSTTTAAITQKPLTISGVTITTSKVYDGGTTVAISGTVALLTVEVAGAGNTSDGRPYTSTPLAMSISGTAVGTYNSKNVGTATTITITGLTLAGSLKANYTIQNTIAATITAKPLTISAPTIASKPYDGTPTAGAVTVGTITVTGFIGTERVTATATAANYPSSAIGSYPGDVVTYTLVNGTGGGLASNYSLANGTATGLIGIVSLTITANNEAKCLGNTLTFAGTEFSTIGLQSGDAVSSVTLTSTGAPSSATIGSYSIVPTAAVGTGLSNYSITYTNGTLTVGGITWTGSLGTDWNNSGNWSCGSVPNSSTSNVVIASSPYPVLSGDITVNNLTLTGSATLSLNGHTLTMDGGFSGTGQFEGSSTSNLVLGGTTGTVSFAAGSDTLENLTLNSSATATLGSTLNITSWTHTPGTVNIGSGATLNTGGTLTLQSNDSSTAIITAIPEDAITGAALGTISGNVTVDRYIHSDVNVPGAAANGSYNTSINNGLRAWRLLTAPVTQTNSESIQAAWQDGGAPYTPGQGIGTLITGPVATNGIDAVSGVSMYSWNTTGQAFTAVTSTFGAISNGNYGGANAGNTGYMIFVRGDRNPASLSNPNFGGININNTTMEPVGNLITGRQVYSVLPSTGTGAGQTRFTLIGNPYASPVDLSAITPSNTRLQYYIWNPNLNTVGGFVVLDLNAGFNVSTPNTGHETQYIQSGQAFFAVGMTGSAASLTFDESNKSNSNNNFVFRPASSAPTQSFVSNLYLLDGSGNTTLADGNLVQYDTNYSAAVDYLDALKLTNTNENFALLRDGVKLAIERRPIIGLNDTLFFNLTQTTQRAYQFQFAATALNHPGLQGFLKDSYTGDSTLLNLNGSTTINFNIDANAASQNANRFMAVFETPLGAGPLPVTFTSIKATQQSDKNIAVQWTVTNQLNIENYEVEKSTNGINFNKVNTTAAVVNGASSIAYNWIDANVTTGNNYYRIVSIGNDGAIAYSPVVDVKAGAIDPAITVYPNPIKDGQINLQFTNLPAGIYGLQLINDIGQVLLTSSVNHPGGSAAQTIQLDNAIAKGVYTLEIIYPDNSKKSIKIMN